MRKIEDFSNDHRGVEAKKVVLEIRKINSSICGFEGMYRCKGTVGLCLMVPFFVFKHTKYIGPCACILEMLSSVKPQRRGVSKRKIPDVHSPVPGKIGGKNGEEKVSDAPYLYHHFWGYPGSCIADLFHSVRKV